MLACKLCGFTGYPDTIAKKPYIFVIFKGGGPDALPPPLLDPRMHTMSTEDVRSSSDFTVAEQAGLNVTMPNIPKTVQWRSQNAKKVTYIKGRLLD